MAWQADLRNQERQQIQEEYEKRRQALVEELESSARSKGFTLVQSPRAGPAIVLFVIQVVITLSLVF